MKLHTVIVTLATGPGVAFDSEISKVMINVISHISSIIYFAFSFAMFDVLNIFIL